MPMLMLPVSSEAALKIVAGLLWIENSAKLIEVKAHRDRELALSTQDCSRARKFDFTNTRRFPGLRARNPDQMFRHIDEALSETSSSSSSDEPRRKISGSSN